MANANVTRLDPPRAVQASQLVIAETATPGLYAFRQVGPAEAFFEEGATPGLYELTDSPVAGARAQMAVVGSTGIIYG